MEDECLTTYEVICKQQEIIRELTDIVSEHDTKIEYLRYMCIWLFTITTIIVILFIVICIAL